jgi:hypothetical protein
MGCGDGSALKAMADYVVKSTVRGRHLDTHPLFVIGADFNEAARARARGTLHSLEAVPGVHTAVVYADVSDPDSYDAELRATGLGVGLNDLVHSLMFLVHNRRLAVRTLAEAQAILRSQLSKVDRGALAHIVCALHPSHLSPESMADLDEARWLQVLGECFRTSFVDERGLVPGIVVGADLVAFMQRWSKYSRHGFVAVEGHSPTTNGLVEQVPADPHAWMRGEKLPHVLNWGMHAFSRQYLLPYEEYRLALALADITQDAVYGSLFGERFPSVDLLAEYRFMSIAAYRPRHVS